MKKHAARGRRYWQGLAFSGGAAGRRAAGTGGAGEPLVDGDAGGAVGGPIHRARQGADQSALHELPSGRRPAAARRRCARLHQPPVPRRGRIRQRGACAARSATGANFDPGRVPGPSAWHLAPLEMAWEGKTLARDLRPDQGSRAQRRPVARRISSSTSAATAWSAGPGRPVRPRAGARHAGGGGRACAAWVRTGAQCPPAE